MSPSRADEYALLLSDRADERLGGQIDELARRAGVRLRRHALSRLPSPRPPLHAAFFSRDLYAGSALRQPGVLSNAFFEVVDQADALRWLHVFTSGRDLPQYGPALAKGVCITTSTGSTALPIAQTVLAAMLAQARGFGHWLAAQARKEWAPLSGDALPRDICDQRVVVVGAGAIGTEIGRLLKAVGFQATAVRRGAVPAPHYDRTVDMAELDTLLGQCDWLVLAVALNAQTRGMIDARRLALLPAHASVVNVARGELVDEAALAQALAQGRLAGAYLDTFVQEPLSCTSPLWSLPGVWISPHNSSASRGHEQRVDHSFLQALRDWLAQCGAANRPLDADA